MEFVKTVKFLGIEERKMKDGKLYAVTFFADGIAFTVYVVEKCADLGRLLSLQFGKELSVKFRLAAYDNAWKIKFVALA